MMVAYCRFCRNQWVYRHERCCPRCGSRDYTIQVMLDG
jgi:RNA polymerase subunit RPABC4/transcription elongation factor Spt4